MKKEKLNQEQEQELIFKEIGQRIRSQREKMHLTRDQLADELNVSTKYLADLEYGYKGMSMHTLYKVAQHLNLTTDYILGSEAYMVAEEVEDYRHVKENILGTISGCNLQQLKCIEQVVRYCVDAILIAKQEDKA